MAAVRQWLLHRQTNYVKKSVFLVANPAAGRGRSFERLADFRARFAEKEFGETYQTLRSGDEERLAERALENGATTIVAFGGDGTCAGIANAILKANSPCRLAVFSAGTGNDFAKTLGVDKHTPERIVELVLSGTSSRIDVGLADGRHFLNSCGFGFDASVLEASNRVRFIKGDAVYIYSALRQLFTYHGVEVSTNVAGATRGEMLMVVVSNGRWLGGAFKIAPHASVLDGHLDACFVSDSNVLERAKVFAGALRGTHVGMASVSMAGVQQLTLTFPSSPLMEVDGELRRAQSKTVELKCIPRALSVVAAPGALV
jgi:diacylglycerol kinase (ATP)